MVGGTYFAPIAGGTRRSEPVSIHIRKQEANQSRASRFADDLIELDAFATTLKLQQVGVQMGIGTTGP